MNPVKKSSATESYRKPTCQAIVKIFYIKLHPLMVKKINNIGKKVNEIYCLFAPFSVIFIGAGG